MQRGARGTSCAQAGNAIDQALLLAEILRVGGHKVRLVHGSLPPAEYTVVIAAAAEELVAKAVPIAAGSDTALTVALKDGHFIINRQ